MSQEWDKVFPKSEKVDRASMENHIGSGVLHPAFTDRPTSLAGSA